MKKVILIVVLIWAVVGAYLYNHYYVQGHINDDVQEEQKLLSPSEDEHASMSFKGINISQGEHGAELWNLKAERAKVVDDGSQILVSTPLLTYFVDGSENILTVLSKTGEVEQGKQEVQFIDDVVVTREDAKLYTNLIFYEGVKHLLTCPNGAKVESPTMQGRADHVSWNLKDEIITGTGSVYMEFANAG